MSDKPVNRTKSSQQRGTKRASRKGAPLWLTVFVWLIALGCLAAGGLIASVLVYYSSQVPDFRQLADYKPSLITKVYDRNGEVIAEYARERRVWVPISDIPKPLIQAFLAAEDTNFFEHGGYDLKAIARAALSNVLTHRTQGASTITQQVAKTFLLSSERTYTRKIKELILSWRIEQAFTKNEILELYLNRIYLGNGSYGIAAAAQTYFSKTLDELTLPERATIAGLPQAPTRYNPVRNPKAAAARRDIVLRRMQAENFITQADADTAIAAPLGLKVSPLKEGQDAPHFSEYVRRQIEKTYGTDALYNDGMMVYTTLDLGLQSMAEDAIYGGLRDYDRRHGWRGPLMHLKSLSDWESALDELTETYAATWRIGEPAVVLKATPKSATIGLGGGVQATLPATGVKWTGRTSVDKLVKPGDVIFVKSVKSGKDEKASSGYVLEQLPKVQGALVAIDVKTGNVLAMVGGIGEGFNRAMQAQRQVGSSFKPFVYAAALEKGYTPASTILDAPIVFRTGDKEWKPQNYDNTIGGETTLRSGLERSRNLMTVRLAQDVGMRSVADVVKRMGVGTPVPITDLSVSLGSVAFNLLDMTSAYAVFPRGGQYVAPSMLQRIQDAQGVTLMREAPVCDACTATMGAGPEKIPPYLTPAGRQALSPQVAYLMTSMLQGVVLRGTGYALNSLGRPMGGKTGTTNDYVDAWFVGFTPSLAVGVWVGMDTPTSLGHGETGARAALPIWKDFMTAALKGAPVENFAVPDGIEFARIDRESGLLPSSATEKTLVEAFAAGTVPSRTTPTWGWGQGDGAPTVEDGADSEQGGGVIRQIFNVFGIY